jgi:hypothetical protein
MESYIVRIYRRSRKEPGEVAGLVETVGTDEKRSFKSFSGLISAIRETIGRNEKNAKFTTPEDLYGKDENSIKKQAG